MSRNRLDQETSPYLLQHRDNPVHWQPWDDAAFDQAERENKPILLSVGYSACHWCHVMAHESFEDAETAALINALTVPIKVDREERPDLDTIYQSALALLGQQGGWPLTMFLTPAGEPFWGGTYFPPTAHYGRPGFRDVVRSIHDVFTREPETIEKNRAAIAEALASLSVRPAGDEIPIEINDRAAQHLLREVDPVHGGLGGAPKFPQASALELLWRAYCRNGDQAFKDAVMLTLGKICQGGIYDHLGGGFARYTVDERWLAPHFEKMLYDNAQLIELLTWAWQDSRDALFATRIAETVDWLMRDMIAPEGGFASAFDADSEGVEGKYYTWSAAEIDALLGARADAFKAIYDVTVQGNWEDTNILNRLVPVADDEMVDEPALAASRAVLLETRAGRVPPERDDKVLADWNGLMIAALATAGATFERADWITAAAAAFDIVRDRLGDGDRLGHSYRAGAVRGAAVLDDYANMARAALALHEATGDAGYLARAAAWVATADAQYWDDDAGGYYYTAADAERLITRTKTAADSAIPSGNGTMVGVLARLHALTAEARYRERAEATVAAFSADLSRNLYSLCTLLNASEILRATTQVVLVGDAAADDMRALNRAAVETVAPNRVLSRVAPDAALPDGHPAAGKGQKDGAATAYVCVGQTCSLPITEPDALRRALAAQAA